MDHINGRMGTVSAKAPATAALAAIIAGSIALRFLLCAYNYRGISLFCGDSAAYYFLANNLGSAYANRPSGFPFFLALVMHVSAAPWFLLALNMLMGIATQLICLGTASRYVGSALPWLAMNAVVFFNPLFIKVNSMVMMADTLACLFLALALWLVLVPAGQRDRQSRVRGVLAMLVVGYLTIVKYAFFYCGFILWIYLAATWRRADGRPARLAAAVLYASTFLAVPLWYAIHFNAPRLGVTSIDNFSGRSLLANMLPHVSCAELLDAAGTPSEAAAITRHCRGEVSPHNPPGQLWLPDSTLNAIERELMANGAAPEYAAGSQRSRVQGNRILGALAGRLFAQHPRLAFEAVVTNLALYVGATVHEQWTVDQRLNIDTACERLIDRYFGLTKAQYLERWREVAGRPGLGLVDRFARAHLDAVEVFALATLLLVAVLAPWRTTTPAETWTMLALSLVYLVSISLGSYYDARVYLPMTLLAYVTAAVRLAPSRP